MLLLERHLGQHFREIDLSYIRQNASPKREGDLQHRVEAIYSDLGTDLTKQFREHNHWDMELYENAQRIFEERLSTLGHKESLMADFQARCQSLLN